jgi:hypothetical protein
VSPPSATGRSSALLRLASRDQPSPSVIVVHHRSRSRFVGLRRHPDGRRGASRHDRRRPRRDVAGAAAAAYAPLAASAATASAGADGSALRRRQPQHRDHPAGRRRLLGTVVRGLRRRRADTSRTRPTAATSSVPSPRSSRTRRGSTRSSRRAGIPNAFLSIRRR